MRRSAGAAAIVLLAGASCQSGAGSPTPPPAGATFGGKVRVSIGQPGSIEPSNAYEPNGELVARTMCDSLLRADPVTGTLRASLAESWLVTDGGQRISLRLRADARFSDGTKVSARDVAFSLSRVASAEYAAATAELLRPIDGFAQMRGEVKATDGERRQLRGVQAVTAETVEIALTEPAADFLAVLSHPVAAPVPRDLAGGQAEDFARQPVCAGPYRLEAPWSPGDPVVRLSRVRSYRGPDPGLADSIEFHTGTSPGEVDVAEVPADGATARGPAPSVEYVGLPSGSGSAFSAPDLRRALSLSIDRTALARDVFKGGRRPATGFLPPSLGTAVYRPAACGSAVPSKPDVEGARALLSRSGIDATVLRLPLVFNDDFDHAALAAALAMQWRDALGLEVELRPVPFTDYLRIGEQQAGFPGPFRQSWGVRYPSADEWLYPLFHTSGIGHANLARYSNAVFDRRLERGARRASEVEDRVLEYQRAEDQLCRELPLLPLTFDEVSYRIAPRLRVARGPAIDGTTGLPRLRSLYEAP